MHAYIHTALAQVEPSWLEPRLVTASQRARVGARAGAARAEGEAKPRVLVASAGHKLTPPLWPLTRGEVCMPEDPYHTSRCCYMGG